MNLQIEDAFYDTKDFKTEGTPLGKGEFGTVYVAKNQKDNQKYAIKIINIDITKGFSGFEQMLFIRESLILHKLHHPSIVKFYGINFQSSKNPGELQPSIVTEYLPNGSLKDILTKERSSIADSDWNPTKKYICLIGIVDALRYLHKNGILHRDLKPENILLDYDYYPRVCDFGLSRCFSQQLTKSLKLSMTGKLGTPLYMAPEILKGEDNHCGPGVDVFAFGILAYELITGLEPYSELGDIYSVSLGIKVLNGHRPQFPKNIKNKTKKLILKCLDDNPNERPSFDEIYELLTNDFTYLDEDVDETEIIDYIQFINEKDKPKEKNDYEEMLKGIAKYIKNDDEMNDAFAKIFENTIKSENIDLVKYLLSLNKISFKPDEI